MARLRTNVLKWGNKHDGPNTYKHGRRGALDDAFWDDDELVDYQKQKKSTKKRQRKPGCPGNDGGSHVYVWVSTTRYRYRLDAVHGFMLDKTRPYNVDEKTCCGCNKVVKRRYNW